MDILNSTIVTTATFLRTSGLVPLTRENWSFLTGIFKYFTLVAPIQLAVDWYPMGKTSTRSPLNVPGKPAWIFMELVSPLTLLLTLYTGPLRSSGAVLPNPHVWLATLFCVHYFHRALLSPLRNPSMAPVHISLVLGGITFNLFNGSAIGGWLGGYGNAQEVPVWQVAVGSVMFLVGLWGNMYHEEILRDIRREAAVTEGEGGKEEEDKDMVVSEEGKRMYKIPHGGLFKYCWYPHYFSEWFEWTGFMVAGGGPFTFLPAALFVVNEIATMGPRALQGRRWYLEKFGAKAPNRRAVIPGVL